MCVSDYNYYVAIMHNPKNFVKQLNAYLINYIIIDFFIFYAFITKNYLIGENSVNILSTARRFYVCVLYRFTALSVCEERSENAIYIIGARCTRANLSPVCPVPTKISLTLIAAFLRHPDRKKFLKKFYDVD